MKMGNRQYNPESAGEKVLKYTKKHKALLRKSGEIFQNRSFCRRQSSWYIMMFSRNCASLKLFYSLYAIRKNLKNNQSQKCRNFFVKQSLWTPCMVSLKYLNASFLIMQKRQAKKSETNNLSFHSSLALSANVQLQVFFKSFLVTKLHFTDLNYAPEVQIQQVWELKNRKHLLNKFLSKCA